MREFVWLECTSCSSRNYRTPKETRGADRLDLKKYCKKERKHTPHKESRKKYSLVPCPWSFVVRRSQIAGRIRLLTKD